MHLYNLLTMRCDIEETMEIFSKYRAAEREIERLKKINVESELTSHQNLVFHP